MSSSPTPLAGGTTAAQISLGQRGDFIDAYDAQMSALIRFVMRLGATPEEAADATQSAFVEAYLRWAQIKAPVAWLRTVATRIYLRQSQPYEEPTSTVPDQAGVGTRWKC